MHLSSRAWIYSNVKYRRGYILWLISVCSFYNFPWGYIKYFNPSPGISLNQVYEGHWDLKPKQKEVNILGKQRLFRIIHPFHIYLYGFSNYFSDIYYIVKG